jgi:glycosyltransferase involved in cell wall biosynthesis
VKVAHLHDVRLEAANGIYKTVAGLAAHLPNEGVTVEAWHLDTKATTVSQRQVGATTVFDLPARARGASALRGLPAETKAWIDRRQREVDLVHIHSAFLPNNVWVAKRLTAVPYVVTAHGGYAGPVLAGSNRLGKAIWLTIAERAMLRRAAVVHAVSEGERDEMSARWPELNVRYVPNGVDLPPAPHGVATPTRQFVFMGRLAIDHKGLDRMTRGFAKFVRDDPMAAAGCRLVLVGPDFRGSRAVLERMATDEGIADRVEFTGPLFGAARDERIAGALAFVHTSRWEGLPFSLLEALAAGVPLLVTPQTNIGSDVARYDAGVQVQPDDASIASGFTRLASASTEEILRMRLAARRLVEENYTWPLVTRRLAEVYRSVVTATATAATVVASPSSPAPSNGPVGSGVRGVRG